MKIKCDDEVIIGSSDADDSTFTIKASGKAFDILSNKLYKYKVRAVVRELSTNCDDAHKLNGNENRPFYIKAPTRLDPRFVIRDYGPGLNHNDMMTMYKTFFESTKNNSNDFIGALGLGSKSPLSYTSTFNVVSYHDGKATGYTVMKNRGEPTIRPMFVDDMKEDEETGLEITVPVKVEDIDTWHYEIAYILRTFGAVPPKVDSLRREIEYFPVDKTDWFSVNSSYESYGLYAVYGKIVYPISGVDVKADWLLNRYGKVYVHFPLGELDITPSREELSLDEETIANIQKRVNALEEEVITADIKAFEAYESDREFLREFNKLSSKERSILQSRGITIGNRDIKQVVAKYNLDKIRSYYVDNEVSVYVSCDEPARRKVSSSSWHRHNQVNISDICGVDRTKAFVLIDDKAGKRIATVRALCKSGLVPIWAHITVIKDNEDELHVIDELKKIMDTDEVVVFRVSELEAQRKALPDYDTGPKEKRPKSPNVSLHWIDKDGYWEEDRQTLLSSEIAELEGYAIGRNRDEIHTFPDNVWWWNMSITDMRSLAEACGIKKFYAIRPGAMKAAVKADGLLSFDRFIIDQYIKCIDKVDYDQYMPSNATGNRICGNIAHYDKLNFLSSKFTASGMKNPFLTKLNKIAKVCRTSKIKDENDDLALCNKIYNKLSGDAETIFYKKIEQFKDDYPVIASVLDTWRTDSKLVDDIVKIMELLDGASTQNSENKGE